MEKPKDDFFVNRKDKQMPKPKHDQSRYSPPCPITAVDESRILVISGLPGSGKTMLASQLAASLGIVHINADQVRQTVNAHLGFDKKSRLLQAAALGNICRWVADGGQKVVVDFVCPDFDTREEFISVTGEHQHHLCWIEIDRPTIVSRFEDTRLMYEPMLDNPNLDLLHLKKFLHLRNVDQSPKELLLKVKMFFTGKEG